MLFLLAISDFGQGTAHLNGGCHLDPRIRISGIGDLGLPIQSVWIVQFDVFGLIDRFNCCLHGSHPKDSSSGWNFSMPECPATDLHRGIDYPGQK